MYLHFKEDYFALFWALVLIGSTFLVIRTRRKLDSLTNYLNIVSILLVAIPMITIMAHRSFSKDYTITELQVGTVNLEESKNYPDIYYIIPDAYARADVLEEIYQYDNSKFLKFLAQEGFYIANKSRCNYAETALSLASSLNLTHLDDLAKQMGPKSYDRLPLQKMICSSRVSEFLKQHGYLIVALSSGVESTEIEVNADIFMTPGLALSEFENLLLSTTPIPILLDKLLGKSQYDLHRDRLLYIFDHLADPTKLDSPVFVFAHILAPHPPFVFGEGGEKVEPKRKFLIADGTKYITEREEYIEDYRNQLIFINKKLQTAINKIISNSPQPPIIILQADHGATSDQLDRENPDDDDINLKERMCILNAYYLPGSGHKELYEEITPVNTFRIIFNQYFGTNLELLEDKSYYTAWPYSYRLIDVTEKINSD